MRLRTTSRRLMLGACALALTSAAGRADEGLWLTNTFPSDRVAARYGFAPSTDWLDHLRLSSLRIAGGCSASFVSPQGLVMTNQHCARKCVAQLSTPQRDLVTGGFHAADSTGEVACPGMAIDQLAGIDDVYGRMAAALAGKEGAAFNAAKQAERAALESACAADRDGRCDLVELYRGGRYHLYRYRRFQDVRLVFAPELNAAYFGGDPDNINYPRFDLDVAFLRVYVNGQPFKTAHHLPFSASGPIEGELIVTAGHRRSTSRLMTTAELSFERSVRWPRELLRLSELRGQLVQYARNRAEQRRHSEETLFEVENRIKQVRGKFEALFDESLMATRQSEERRLRDRLAADARPAYAGAFAAIDHAVAAYRAIFDRYELLELGSAFDSRLFPLARALVRRPAESDSVLPDGPVYPELETLRLAFGLSKLQETLGPDDPLVQRVLARRSPARRADELVTATALADLATRQRLYEGGATAVAASTDPMLELVRAVEDAARQVRRQFETEVEEPLSRAHELLAAARFEQSGAATYPDATGTMRFTYGAMRGYEHRGQTLPPFTTLGAAFERATGEEPFALPDSWLKAKPRIRLDTPLNFVMSNDIAGGGNSGSPAVNRRGQIVGLVFDVTQPALRGEYGYDEAINRGVAVHSAAILESLDAIYSARRLVDELRAARLPR